MLCYLYMVVAGQLNLFAVTVSVRSFRQFSKQGFLFSLEDIKTTTSSGSGWFAIKLIQELYDAAVEAVQIKKDLVSELGVDGMIHFHYHTFNRAFVTWSAYTARFKACTVI